MLIQIGCERTRQKRKQITSAEELVFGVSIRHRAAKKSDEKYYYIKHNISGNSVHLAVPKGTFEGMTLLGDHPTTEELLCALNAEKKLMKSFIGLTKTIALQSNVSSDALVKHIHQAYSEVRGVSHNCTAGTYQNFDEFLTLPISSPQNTDYMALDVSPMNVSPMKSPLKYAESYVENLLSDQPTPRYETKGAPTATDAFNHQFSEAIKNQEVEDFEKKGKPTATDPGLHLNVSQVQKQLDGRDYGHDLSGDAFEYSQVFSMRKNKRKRYDVYLEWKEDPVGQYGKKRFEWQPLANLSLQDRKRFKDDYKELDEKVCYCLICNSVDVIFFNDHITCLGVKGVETV